MVSSDIDTMDCDVELVLVEIKNSRGKDMDGGRV